MEDCATATPLELRLARMLAPYRPYLRQYVHFDDTRTLLRPMDVACARLDAASIKRFVDQASRSEPLE